MNLQDFQRLCDRLNPYCRHALEAAVLLCRERTHFEITLEHLFTKLLDDPNGDIGLIARACGIDLGEWSGSVSAAVDRLKSGNTGGVHWTEDVIRLIERAWLLSSAHYGFQAIRSGTLLVALAAILEEGGGMLSAEVQEPSWLRSVSVISKRNVRDELPSLIKGSSEGSAEAGPAVSSAPRGGGASALERFTVNLNELARQGKLDRALGRDSELRRVVDILCRRRKNNAILVGEPGVGKTAVVEGLARRIVEGDVPSVLAESEILSLDLGLLQAGAGVKGEFENRIKQIIEGVANHPKAVVLFIDEAHLLIGAGNQAGGGDAANLLKPALARGQLRSIAATTWTEYKKYFEKDAALQDRFEVVKVEEPDEALAAVMLRGTKDAYEEHHSVQILDDGITAAVSLSNRYLTGRQLPRKAVDLLDTAAARVRVGLSSKPAPVDDLERRVENLSIERRARQRDHEAGLSDHHERLAELDGLIQQAEKDLGAARDRWNQEKAAVEAYVSLRDAADGQHQNDAEQAENKSKLSDALKSLRAIQGRHPMVPVHLDAAVAAQVIADWTGIPVGNMVEEEMPKLLNLEDRLRERVRGQDHALRKLAETIRINKVGLGNPAAPIGIFLLVGPSGTGKTETALALADILFGGERFCTTINMSEFKEEHTVSLLIGSPPGYVGYGEGGVLTEAVRQRPYTVVLLDEVEKAHPKILELFYQIFDKGYCEDRTGRVINFRNTIILMTSNLDSERITEMCGIEPRPDAEEILSAIRPTLSNHFKPALLARFRVIPYYPLGPGVLREIVDLKLGRVSRRLRDVHGIEMRYDDAVADALVSRCQVTELGARQLDHAVAEQILPSLSGELLSRLGQSDKPRRVTLTLEESGTFGYRME